MFQNPDKFICTNCGFELSMADNKDLVAIAAEAPPAVGLSTDPLGVEVPEPDDSTPVKYNITKCPNCGNEEWHAKE